MCPSVLQKTRTARSLEKNQRGEENIGRNNIHDVVRLVVLGVWDEDTELAENMS